MTDLNTFGGRFKAFRKSKKLKGDDLGEILRVKKAQIAMIEKSITKTPAEKLIELATAFPDLDLNWLLTGKGDMLLDPGQEKLRAVLQSEQEELRSVRQELHAVKEERQSLNQELQSVRQRLQAVEEELQAVKQALESEQQEHQSTRQQLEKEQDMLRAVREKLDGARNKSEAMEELLVKNQIVIPKYGGASRGR